ncbi:sugar-binding protein [Thiospirochaeta perfilievii]|nr:sugar-binding protein [Thiospirochaeta perfilievii]
MLKKIMLAQTILLFVVVSGFSLTTTEKKPVPSPWNESMAEASANRIKPPVGEVTPVYWVDEIPVIDGIFGEWEGFDGPTTRVVVLGSSHDPKDGEARFVLKTDGSTLFIYSRVTDDIVNENKLSGSMAWRGDSVEMFIGIDTSSHKKYKMTDNQIRLVPVSKDDPFAFEVSINDVTKTSQVSAAFSYNEDGYEVEAAIPLSILMIKELKPGQKIKCEFQLNDADDTERDRLVHWMSEKDDPWNDASVWGKGQVVKKGEE